MLVYPPRKVMRILFDHSTPAPLRRHLPGHEVKEAFELGWERLSNGELFNAAEKDGFEILITGGQKHPLPAEPHGP